MFACGDARAVSPKRWSFVSIKRRDANPYLENKPLIGNLKTSKRRIKRFILLTVFKCLIETLVLGIGYGIYTLICKAIHH